MRIFLDANILIAATASPDGGSGYIFRVAENDASWQLLTSVYALQEARRNVLKKLPSCEQTLIKLIVAPELVFVHDPPRALVELANAVVPKKDAPILAAALSAKADVLCTLDIKDFHSKQVKDWCKKFNLRI